MELLDYKYIDDFLQDNTIVEGISNASLIFFTFSIAVVLCVVISKLTEVAPLLVHPDVQEHLQSFRRTNALLSDEEIRRRVAEAQSRQDEICAICFGNLRFTVLTNCGHMFCCECINGYWSFQGNVMHIINCPICRTPVSLLLPVNWPTEPDETTDLTENTERLDGYNRRFSGNRPWADYVADLPVIIPYILRNIFGFQGLMIMFRLRVLLIVMVICGYVLSPFDIIPEAVYGALGLMDDIFVVILLLVYISIAIRHFLARRGDFD